MTYDYDNCIYITLFKNEVTKCFTKTSSNIDEDNLDLTEDAQSCAEFLKKIPPAVQ